MRRLFFLLVLVVSAAGCGGGDNKTEIDRRPLTDAEKEAIKQLDKAVDDDERGGSGTATGKPKKR